MRHCVIGIFTVCLTLLVAAVKAPAQGGWNLTGPNWYIDSQNPPDNSDPNRQTGAGLNSAWCTVTAAPSYYGQHLDNAASIMEISYYTVTRVGTPLGPYTTVQTASSGMMSGFSYTEDALNWGTVLPWSAMGGSTTTDQKATLTGTPAGGAQASQEWTSASNQLGYGYNQSPPQGQPLPGSVPFYRHTTQSFTDSGLVKLFLYVRGEATADYAAQAYVKTCQDLAAMFDCHKQ